MILVYIFAKFCIYCGLCYGLARVFRLRLESNWIFSITWGGVRLLVGVAFGLPIAYTFAASQGAGNSDLVSYLLAFGPFRVIEWGLLFALVARKHPIRWESKAYGWVLVGTVASMVFDGLALAGGLDRIKFFC